MTVANCTKNLARFAGEKFSVDPTAKMRNDDKIVETQLSTLDRAVPFNYRMRLAEDKWKIVDIYLNGYVSQIALRRAYFASTRRHFGGRWPCQEDRQSGNNWPAGDHRGVTDPSSAGRKKS